MSRIQPLDIKRDIYSDLNWNISTLMNPMPGFPRVIDDQKTFQFDLNELVSKQFQLWWKLDVKPNVNPDKMIEFLQIDTQFWNEAVNKCNTRFLMLFLDLLGNRFDEVVSFKKVFAIPYILDPLFLKCLEDVTSFRPDNLLGDLVNSRFIQTEPGLIILNSMLRSGQYHYQSVKNPMLNPNIPESCRMTLLEDFMMLSHNLDPKHYRNEIFLLLKEYLSTDLKQFALFMEKYKIDELSSVFDDEGNSVLHYVARSQCTEFVQKLVEKGHDLDHVNFHGFTPMNFAISHSNKVMIDKFQQLGAKYVDPTIHDLPVEVREYICCWLTWKDINNLKLSCKEWCQIGDSEVVAQAQTMITFGYTHDLFRDSWKCVYYGLMSSTKLAATVGSYLGPFVIKGFCTKEWRECEFTGQEIVKQLILQNHEAPTVRINLKFLGNTTVTNTYDPMYRNELLDSIRAFKTIKKGGMPYKPVDAYWRRLIEKSKWKLIKETELPERDSHIFLLALKSFCTTKHDLELLVQGKRTTLPSNVLIYQSPCSESMSFYLLVSDDLVQMFIF